MPFHVHNAVRSRHNRTLRAQQPKHHGLKQYIGGGKYRSIRGRPIFLTDEEFELHRKEIEMKVAAGIFTVTTVDGRPVDLGTMAAPPVPPSPPLPNPPMDSIANDKQNVGQEMPQFPGGSAEGSPTDELPDLLAGAESSVSLPEPTPEPTTLPEGGKKKGKNR